METRTYKVFTFEELTKEQQAKAIERYRDINTEDDWYEPIYEGSYERLAEIGYEDAKIYFSGFWSQGDGASFTATVDIAKWIAGHDKAFQKKYALLSEQAKNGAFDVSITTSGRYNHENTMSIDVEQYPVETGEQLDKIYDIENLILEEAREEARAIYKNLEKYYYELTSEEYIKDTLLANDYLFTEEGKID